MTTGTAQFIKIKHNDNILDIAIQQYEIGLYVCIYQDGRMVDQFGSDLTEAKFIEKLKNDKNIEVIES
jgi:hypothetical protein